MRYGSEFVILVVYGSMYCGFDGAWFDGNDCWMWFV